MANATVNLSLAKSGYVKEANPYTVYTTNSSTQYQISRDSNGNECILYFGFSEIPNNLRHNVLIKMSITFAARCQNVSAPSIYVTSCKDFDASKLTYNNKPADSYYGFSGNVDPSGATTLKDFTIADDHADHINDFFKNSRAFPGPL